MRKNVFLTKYKVKGGLFMRGKKEGRKRLLAMVLAGALISSGLPGGVQKAQAAETESVTITTEKDVYVQGGSDKDKVMNGSNIVVKTPESASLESTYHRRGLIEFDLTEVPENCNTAVLKLQVASLGKQYTGTDRMDVYTTETGWDASAMTWNNMPERTSEEAVAYAYKADIDGNQGVGDFMCIDISDAVTEALENGETAISLELEFPVPQGGDHALYFSRHTAEGKTGPQLVLSYDEVKDQYDEIFAGLRTKWHDYIVGSDLDLTDETVSDYVASVHETAAGYLADMNQSDETGRTTLWDDLPITVYASSNTSNTAKTSSGNVTTNFQRLKALALAYETEGGSLYQDEELFSEIISGLDFMVDTYYNGSTSTNWGNWYHWEIGTPQALASTLVILYDHLTDEQLERYLTGIERYDSGCGSAGIPGSPTMTGANLLDKALVVAQAGVLTNDEQKLEHVRDAQKDVYTYVTDDDGFYEDGSFIQHHTLAYTAGYGSTLYGGIGVFFYMLDGTPWAIQYEDGSEQMVYDTIFNGIEPLIYDMQMADSTAGRGIVRSTADTRTRAVDTVAAILPIGASMKGEMKEKFDSFVKDFIQTDEEYYFDHMGNITNIQLSKAILNDDSVQPREDYSIHKTYAGMDRVSHVRPGYMFNIAMSSTRQSKFENYSGEGLKTWNIADGMTYLYTDDLGQYTNDYWAVIDPFRLPGTTSERALSRADFTAQAESGRTPYSWAGGVTLGTYGTAGVQMKALGNENSGNGSSLTGADSKKSWFMFDDEIVAIGSSITSTTGNCVETTIDNRQISEDLSNKVTIDGETPDITDNSDNNDKHGKVFEDVTWANIEGNTENSSIGYYFPEEGTTINALKEFRESNYSAQIDGADQAADGGYAALWVDHGKNPADESYEYVLLPGMDADETAAYAENPQIEVLENSDSVHAVRHNGLGMTGINFWNDGGTTAAGVTSDSKASVMMQQTEDTLEIAVSDPTQENNGTIELTVDIPCTAVISKDDTVTVNETGDQVKISVNVAGAMGGSHTVKLQLAEQSDEVDKSGLEALYDQYKDLDETGYIKDTWNTFAEALKEAEQVLHDAEATQEQADAAQEELQAAVDGLRVSKTTLEYFLNKAKSYVENGDTEDLVESVQKLFEEAIAEGDAVMAKENATKDEVTNATWKLVNAIGALNMKAGDKTDLEMALELADMIDLDKYVEDGQAAFLEAKEAAEKVLADGDALEAEIETAWSDLTDAMSALRLKADKAALEELINSLEALDLSQYTENSVQTFNIALAAAKAVMADETLSVEDQQTVDEAVQALVSAKDALALKDDASEEPEKEDPSDTETEDGSNSNKDAAADENSGSGTDGSSATAGNPAGGSDAPKTGDQANLLLWAAVLALAGGLGITVRSRKTREN